MEVPEEPEAKSLIDPRPVLTETIVNPLARLIEQYKLGEMRVWDPENLQDGRTVCAFEIKSAHHYLDCVFCFFEKGGAARFVRLLPTGTTNVLEGSWIFVVYMTIPFLQELATRQQKVNSQVKTLKKVVEILKEGERDIL